jgi:hypothetical protein
MDIGYRNSYELRQPESAMAVRTFMPSSIACIANVLPAAGARLIRDAYALAYGPELSLMLWRQFKYPLARSGGASKVAQSVCEFVCQVDHGVSGPFCFQEEGDVRRQIHL